MKGHPVLWIILAGVLAPMLSKITKRFKAPVVVIEVILGIVIGPHVLGFIQFNDFLSIMFTFGMAATLFMGGMELEFNKNSVRPLSLAAQGWGISLLLAILAVLLLHFIPDVHAPMIVVLALCTTGLGIRTSRRRWLALHYYRFCYFRRLQVCCRPAGTGLYRTQVFHELTGHCCARSTVKSRSGRLIRRC